MLGFTRRVHRHVMAQVFFGKERTGPVEKVSVVGVFKPVGPDQPEDEPKYPT